MKYLISVAVITLLVGCSQKTNNLKEQNQNSNEVNYGEKLYDSGFLKYTDSFMHDSLKNEVINSFYIYNEDNNKIVHIDAEELAEFSFDFFLPELNKILEKRGFKLNVSMSNDYESSNDIFVNEEKVKLYTEAELDKGNFWDSASRNFFKSINLQLKDRKIDETFYLLYEGNDLHVILLTDEEYNIIAEKYRDEPKEIPYLP